MERPRSARDRATFVRDPTDELVVFAVGPQVMQLPADLRDDYCYWPMVTGIATHTPLTPLGPVQDASFQFMAHPDDRHGIVLRHPCAECRASVARAAEMLAAAEPGSLTFCVAQCVVVYLSELSSLAGRFSPTMRTTDSM